MAVTTGPDKIACLQAGLLGHHVSEQCIRGDIKRHAQKDIRAALIQLTGKPPIGYVELEQENVQLKQELSEQLETGGIVGKSGPLQELLSLILGRSSQESHRWTE